jgi:MerR family redox-sensitive transcriptional activator SoxR
MTIGEVAKRSGLAASAIRYYEQAGVLPKPGRIGGRRQYDPSILERLAVVDRAKACGFTLAETRRLFYGFREAVPAPERWRTLARRKLQQLEELTRQIEMMKELLQRPCTCRDLAECGRRISAARTSGQTSC